MSFVYFPSFAMKIYPTPWIHTDTDIYILWLAWHPLKCGKGETWHNTKLGSPRTLTRNTWQFLIQIWLSNTGACPTWIFHVFVEFLKHHIMYLCWKMENQSNIAFHLIWLISTHNQNMPLLKKKKVGEMTKLYKY